MAVVAGYTAVFLVPQFHLPEVLSFLVVVPIFGVVGYVVQRTLIQKSIDRDPFTTLLVTFGLSVVIENLLLEIVHRERAVDQHRLDRVNSWQPGFDLLSLLRLAGGTRLVGRWSWAPLQLFLAKTEHRTSDPSGLRRPRSGTALRHQLSPHLRHRLVHRLRDRRAGRNRLRDDDTVHPHERRHQPALRLRGGRHRWHRLALGHPRRRHRARHRPTVRRALQSPVPGPWAATSCSCVVLAIRPQGLFGRKSAMS